MTQEPKPENWDPRTEPDKLRALAQISAAMLHGRPAFDQRLDEMAGGYPSTGDGGSGTSEEGGSTSSTALANLEGRTDVADRERAEWERALRKALEQAAVAWELYKRVAHPRPGVPRLVDPGCELCAKVPCGCDRCSALDGRHWCGRFAAIDFTEPGRKGTKPTKRPMVLCTSCYEFQRPDRAGRLPTHDEVLDHVEGRRRRWKVGA